jgi:hypothetical protein
VHLILDTKGHDPLEEIKTQSAQTVQAVDGLTLVEREEASTPVVGLVLAYCGWTPKGRL